MYSTHYLQQSHEDTVALWLVYYILILKMVPPHFKHRALLLPFHFPFPQAVKRKRHLKTTLREDEEKVSFCHMAWPSHKL